MTRMYRRSVLVFSLVAIGLGVALLAKTASEGGGTFGYVLGALFIVLGTARFYILVKTK
jgi:hypothetical protein